MPKAEELTDNKMIPEPVIIYENPEKIILLSSDLWYTLCITYKLPGGDGYAKYNSR